MIIQHHMKKENSGLARSTLEIVAAEENQGHKACIKEPSGGVIYGREVTPDIHCVHSQLPIDAYFDNIPKVMWMHGEPLSTVGNGVSMKAIVDLAPKMDAFIAMREDEVPVWDSIRRTFYVPKGIDLDQYKPLGGITEKLSGEPAVLYVENWRGQRNPLYLCVAMQEVYKKYPKARLHLFNCPKGKMHDTFEALIKHNKWWPFVRTLSGPTEDVNLLYNRVDMVVSCLDPLYARGIEAFGAGKAFIGPGYKEHDYPFTCALSPSSIAGAIMKCWENYEDVDYRDWAIAYHDVEATVREAVKVYERFTR